MSTLASQIQSLTTAIEEHRSDLATLYSDLGKSAVNTNTPLAKALLKHQEEYEKQEEMYQQVASSIKQLEDRTRKLKQVEKDLHLLEKKRKMISVQLGAIAYERNQNKNLSPSLETLLTPILKEGKRVKPLRAITFLHRRSLSRRFRVIGEIILEHHQEDELVQGELFEAVEEYRKNEHFLREELVLHQSALRQLKSSETQGPRLRLEGYNQSRIKAQKAYEEATIAYGKEVYTNQGVQNPLTVQITLHRTRINQLTTQITEKQNQIKIEELEKQIEIEEQKIAHIADQIGALRGQIDSLNQTIAKRRSEIRSLKGPLGDG
ncbi:MAG: hypothetical protein WC954_04375 [Sphaerochaeta sp.]